jgi:hypothetical protein
VICYRALNKDGTLRTQMTRVTSDMASLDENDDSG